MSDIEQKNYKINLLRSFGEKYYCAIAVDVLIKNLLKKEIGFSFIDDETIFSSKLFSGINDYNDILEDPDGFDKLSLFQIEFLINEMLLVKNSYKGMNKKFDWLKHNKEKITKGLEDLLEKNEESIKNKNRLDRFIANTNKCAKDFFIVNEEKEIIESTLPLFEKYFIDYNRIEEIYNLAWIGYEEYLLELKKNYKICRKVQIIQKNEETFKEISDKVLKKIKEENKTFFDVIKDNIELENKENCKVEKKKKNDHDIKDFDAEKLLEEFKNHCSLEPNNNHNEEKNKKTFNVPITYEENTKDVWEGADDPNNPDIIYDEEGKSHISYSNSNNEKIIGGEDYPLSKKQKDLEEAYPFNPNNPLNERNKTLLHPYPQRPYDEYLKHLEVRKSIESTQKERIQKQENSRRIKKMTESEQTTAEFNNFINNNKGDYMNNYMDQNNINHMSQYEMIKQAQALNSVHNNMFGGNMNNGGLFYDPTQMFNTMSLYGQNQVPFPSASLDNVEIDESPDSIVSIQERQVIYNLYYLQDKTGILKTKLFSNPHLTRLEMKSYLKELSFNTSFCQLLDSNDSSFITKFNCASSVMENMAGRSFFKLVGVGALALSGIILSTAGKMLVEKLIAKLFNKTAASSISSSILGIKNPTFNHIKDKLIKNAKATEGVKWTSKMYSFILSIAKKIKKILSPTCKFIFENKFIKPIIDFIKKYLGKGVTFVRNNVYKIGNYIKVIFNKKKGKTKIISTQPSVPKTLKTTDKKLGKNLVSSLNSVFFNMGFKGNGQIGSIVSGVAGASSKVKLGFFAMLNRVCITFLGRATGLVARISTYILNGIKKNVIKASSFLFKKLSKFFGNVVEKSIEKSPKIIKFMIKTGVKFYKFITYIINCIRGGIRKTIGFFNKIINTIRNKLIGLDSNIVSSFRDGFSTAYAKNVAVKIVDDEVNPNLSEE